MPVHSRQFDIPTDQDGKENSMTDRDAATEQHIATLPTRLSLEQKVRLLSGAGFWSTQAEPAIGLGRIVVSDGPAGVRGEVWDERDPSASLPSPTAFAATWDEDLVARLAELLAAEARRKGVHVVLGPTINLHRSPLGGRHFECFSEDPLLTGRIATAYVRALQSYGIGATPKHYVANDSETDRFTVDVRIDERTLRELYLAPFEQTVRDGAWLVMSAYNSVDGRTMTESPLLTEPLKGEWGFDGVVVSDWTAVRSTEDSGAAGNDLAMPGPSTVWGQPLVEAVRAGRVPEAAIDEKLRRVLRLAGRVGVLDDVDPSAALAPRVDSSAELLREAAAGAVVLMRNERALLPLETSSLRRVAMIGPNAGRARIQGGGSATVIPEYAVSPLHGVRTALGDGAEVTHHVGVGISEGLPPVPVEQLTNPDTGAAGLSVRLVDSDGAVLETQDRDTSQLVWLGEGLGDTHTIEVRTRLRATRDGTHHLGAAGVGPFRLTAGETALIDEVILPDSDDLAAAFLAPPHRTGEVWLTAGQEVELTLTHRVVDTGFGAAMTLGAAEDAASADEEIAAAVAAAEASDVAVVVVGTTARTESEGYDRTTLALPGRQDELVRAVAAANPRTVVVVNSGAPVELPWHTEVAAILLGWFPGQEFGNALADVLLGRREPGGRLPTTWAVRQDDVPVLDTRPRDGAWTTPRACTSAIAPGAVRGGNRPTRSGTVSATPTGATTPWPGPSGSPPVRTPPSGCA